MKEKQRQPQPDSAIISNLRYAYGMLFREYPITRLLLPLTVLVSVLFPLTGNLLPAMIVAMLEKQNLAGFAAAVAAVGMVMLLLGRVPREGDSVDWADWKFEVVDMDGRRIDKVLAIPLSGAKKTEEPEGSSAS